MADPGINRYRFHCEVVEIISTDEIRMVKAMCNPGSIMIEIPDDGQVQLGDVLTISGTMNIEEITTESRTKP